MTIFNHGELVGWTVIFLGATIYVIGVIRRKHQRTKRLKRMVEHSIQGRKR